MRIEVSCWLHRRITTLKTSANVFTEEIEAVCLAHGCSCLFYSLFLALCPVSVKRGICEHPQSGGSDHLALPDRVALDLDFACFLFPDSSSQRELYLELDLIRKVHLTAPCK